MNPGRLAGLRRVSVGTVRWRRVASAFLPALFATVTLKFLIGVAAEPWLIGLDARIYYRATSAWLSGGNPWLAASDGFTFAAPPPTLLFMLPASVFPEPLAATLLVATAAASAAYSVRRLGLPPYWLLFPPLVEGVIVGNLNLAVLALLLIGTRTAAVIAALAKIYAAVPLLLRGSGSALAALGAVLLVSLPLLPWWTFIQDGPRIGATLTAQAAGFSAVSVPVLIASVTASLLVLGRKRSAWLAVPALWPATQAHYEVLALPAMHPILGALAAIRAPWSFSVGVILYAVWTVALPYLRPSMDSPPMSPAPDAPTGAA